MDPSNAYAIVSVESPITHGLVGHMERKGAMRQASWIQGASIILSHMHFGIGSSDAAKCQSESQHLRVSTNRVPTPQTDSTRSFSAWKIGVPSPVTCESIRSVSLSPNHKHRYSHRVPALRRIPACIWYDPGAGDVDAVLQINAGTAHRAALGNIVDACSIRTRNSVEQ